MQKIQRYFLEIIKKDYKKCEPNLSENFKINLDDKKNFDINKFFYKQIGIDHYWRDRLIWSDKEWSNYIKDRNLETWILKTNNDLVGFYEQKYHKNNEVELINMGIMKEYRGKKIGSKLLLHSIKTAFQNNSKRMWVHTCSLDHKYALQNYLSKGFKVFKKEEISFVA